MEKPALTNSNKDKCRQQTNGKKNRLTHMSTWYFKKRHLEQWVFSTNIDRIGIYI